MLLAIDCGNTNSVFALFDGGQKKAVWRCKSDASRTADEYASWLMPLLTNAGIGFSDVTAALISSVVPDANFNLDRLCSNYFKVLPKFVKSPEVKIGIEIDMPRPSEVGADRLVNAVAAKAQYATPLIVIDFGTATTFDVVNAKGQYCGGVIAPGINLSMEALHRAAAALPKISVERTDRVIGNSTVTAMQSGLYWGYLSMIEGIITRMGQELGQLPTVIATGGLAGLFADGTQSIHHIEPDLTLDGLRLIYEANKPAESLSDAA